MGRSEENRPPRSRVPLGGRYRIGNVAVPLWEMVDGPLLAPSKVDRV
ncbi:hypothetical protein [Streptomyces gardneri]